VLRLAFLALIAFLVWFVPNAGSLLIEQEPPEPADAIVVLAGNAPDRMAHALRLRQQGHALLLVVSNERLHTHGLDITWWELHRAGRSGVSVPDSALLVIDPPPENTLDEARRSAELLAAHGARSALLVTDAFHSRRSALLFRAVYARRGLTVRSTPVLPDSLDLARWWATPLAARRTAEEWVKLAGYLLQGAYW
jgi:uncharacterized SAM-binding protein YcdF (DUF218 family)